METFAVAATQSVATPSSSVDRGHAAGEVQLDRWPGWVRLAILIGGSAALWGGIAWAAVRVLNLG